MEIVISNVYGESVWKILWRASYGVSGHVWAPLGKKKIYIAVSQIKL